MAAKSIVLTEAVEQELTKFRNTLDLLEQGAIDPDKEFKPYRLVHGVYGQRQGGTNQMIRIKLKYGVVSPDQMRVLADLSEEYSNGISHITTRQAIQYHYVELENTADVLRRLEECGLTTREACGNAVRAVCGSPNGGTRADEPFAFEPYAEAIFQHFLRGPRSATLPRKFKIALAGSDRDPLQQVNIQDVGAMAVVKDGKEGFRVVAAAGLGSSAQAPVLLYDCLPKDQLLEVCDALVRVHHKYGDRTNRAKARLKFVLRNHGEDGFKKLFEECLDEARKDGVKGKLLPDTLPAANPTPIPAAAGAEGAWRLANVRSHRQPGLAVVSLTIPKGDISAERMRILANLSEKYTDGDARTTNDQNVVFRHVQIEKLSGLFVELSDLGYEKPAHALTDVVSCPGASTCMLGICLSKNLGAELSAGLADVGLSAKAMAGRINISGCPNSCGQHHIGTIGLHGAASKIGDKLVPHYVLFVGGGDEGEAVHHGSMICRIPVRKVVTVVKQLAQWFAVEAEGEETFSEYLRRIAGAHLTTPAEARTARAALKERLTPLFAYGEGELKESDLYDFGADKLFSLDELGAGECMA